MKRWKGNDDNDVYNDNDYFDPNYSHEVADPPPPQVILDEYISKFKFSKTWKV